MPQPSFGNGRNASTLSWGREGPVRVKDLALELYPRTRPSGRTRARGEVPRARFGAQGIDRRLTSSFELVGPVVGRFEGDSNVTSTSKRETTGASLVPSADYLEGNRCRR